MISLACCNSQLGHSLYNCLCEFGTLNHSLVRDCIIRAVQGEAFRGFTGPGANSKEKLFGRVAEVSRVIREAYGV